MVRDGGSCSSERVYRVEINILYRKRSKYMNWTALYCTIVNWNDSLATISPRLIMVAWLRGY